jgi:hypothetical protein
MADEGTLEKTLLCKFEGSLMYETTCVSPLQLSKALLPIDFTLLGMVTDVSPLQL